MKLGQLTKYNMKNVFLEKSLTKCDGVTSLRHFFEKSQLTKSLDQQSEVSYSLLSLCVQVEGHQNVLKLRYSQNTFTSYKVSLKEV